MINHFTTYQKAEGHLITKGFAQKGSIWISRDGHVQARIHTDPHRGVYVQFREMVGE